MMILRGDAYGRPTGYDGQFLRDFDFDHGEGIGMIELTPDVERAKQFEDLVQAVEYRNTVPERYPTRPDGLPNRPLTSTTWEITPVETVRRATGSRHPAANEERN